MTYLIVIAIGIVLVSLLFGFKDMFHMLAWSWDENGKFFTVYIAILLILLFGPVLSKSYAPHLHDTSIIVLMAYVGLYFVLRVLNIFKSD